jgi:predicted NAD/FAD-binding protein
MLNIAGSGWTENSRKVAVIGSGISGMAAAWLLGKTLNVTLFEADDRLGGHANTVTAETAAGMVRVDTGFVVYNDRNYPNLVALFDYLDVKTDASDMSFAASVDSGGFEYSGTDLKGLIGQKSNIIRPRFWRMMTDVMRFYRNAPMALAHSSSCPETLGDYLAREKYSDAFIRDHLLPMGAAIWSASMDEMRAYPLFAFIRFFESHGLLSIADRPAWRTVNGGSRHYIDRIFQDFSGKIRLSSPVKSVRRLAGCVEIITRDGVSEQFSEVVIATHADQALSMLAEPADDEKSLLGAFRYTQNLAVLHADPHLMPRRKQVWSSWNYIANDTRRSGNSEQLCVTYWMNNLQNIDRRNPVFLTLNPCREIRADQIYGRYQYSHPLFDSHAIAAQRHIWQIQGRGGVWFAGAHFGSGFHEDGLQSGLAVAESIGGLKRPWKVDNESGRIYVGNTMMAAE